MNYKYYKSCIDACLECAAICNYCASESLKEKHIALMSRCVQLDMECAAICTLASQLMSLGSDHATEICKICAQICKECADECSKHENDHCRECTKVCYACEKSCREM
jgi:hypothetical protein